MKNRIYLQGFVDGEPFTPTCKEVIYIPFAGNEILDSFFSRNLDKVKKMFKEKLNYDFIYIPELTKFFGNRDILKYYHPQASSPSSEAIKSVNESLINKHVHNEDASMLAPGLLHFMKTIPFKEFEGEHKGCYEFSYFPLQEGTDDCIFASLNEYAENCGESYCHINYGHPKIDQYSYADQCFYSSQKEYFELHKDKDLSGITRFVVDSLTSKEEISRIEISSNGSVAMLDYDITLEMEPMLCAIYILFLRHPEGIVFANLPNYSDELEMIINRLGIDDEETLQFLSLAFNSNTDVIDHICGLIYSHFREIMDEKVAAPYIIQAAPYKIGKEDNSPYIEMGEPKKVFIERNLVSLEKLFI